MVDLKVHGARLLPFTGQRNWPPVLTIELRLIQVNPLPGSL